MNMPPVPMEPAVPLPSVIALAVLVVLTVILVQGSRSRSHATQRG